ncbi:MAG: family 20 glycosylhydrolase [Calditrichaeota bacterium]|nr:family 20 glycosylhydrolase [Calditrichota bacterium]
MFLFSCSIPQKLIIKESKPVIPVIPKPFTAELKRGSFTFSGKTIFAFTQPDIKEEVNFLADFILKKQGIRPSVVKKPISSLGGNFVFFTLNPEMRNSAAEGYRLEVKADRILITAKDKAGLFYGIQTLRQLLPPEFENPGSDRNEWQIPCVIIEDRPRYPWRGMMLDVSRHFFSKEFVKKFIDYLAFHKMNYFHWHLCDDQGWRIEIKKYPKLTEVGAWRVDREDQPWRTREEQKPGEKATYGGFYTQDDIREIVEYARRRHVTIVPEIEMPGHTRAALAAYPQFSCTGGPFTVLPGGYWPIRDIYCAGKDSTFLFLEDILKEVMDLFPGKYIHIGGDEADKANWEICPDCRRRMKEENLASVEELQSYFIRRMEKFINANGRKLIGWDEILQGGLAPRATVMSWRGYEGGIEAARSGHDVIMTPTSHCYFDYYQGPRDLEPEAIGGYLPLSKVYRFEPTPDSLTAEEAKHVLGGQANLWTEFIPTPEQAEYMTFPRIAAMSEALWSFEKNKDWDDFAARLTSYLQRLDALNINYARSVFNVIVGTSMNLKTKDFFIELQTEIPDAEIRFRLDGLAPDANSTLYEAPIVVRRSAELTAACFKNGKRISKITNKSLILHKATGKKVLFRNPYAEKYSGGGEYALTNCLNGSLNFGDGNWVGFHQVDLEATIDLKEPTIIGRIVSSYLNDISSWIFLPRRVDYQISDDGLEFKTVAVIGNELPVNYSERMIKKFDATFQPVKSRYVRVLAKNVGVCPEWHPGAGDKAWLFIDEIIVE